MLMREPSLLWLIVIHAAKQISLYIWPKWCLSYKNIGIYLYCRCMCPYDNTLLKWFPVEDVSDLWPTVKTAFEERSPFKRACLNNKTRNPVFVETLPAEFILTTDSRLRSRFPQEQLLFWFREPYATVILVTCEVTRKLIDCIYKQ